MLFDWYSNIIYMSVILSWHIILINKKIVIFYQVHVDPVLDLPDPNHFSMLLRAFFSSHWCLKQKNWVNKRFSYHIKFVEKCTISLKLIIKATLPLSCPSSSWRFTRRYFPIRFWAKSQNKKLNNRHEDRFIFYRAKVRSIPLNNSSQLFSCWIGMMTEFKQKRYYNFRQLKS